MTCECRRGGRAVGGMNKDFMEYMREHYNHLTQDHFGHTVVSPGEDEES